MDFYHKKLYDSDTHAKEFVHVGAMVWHSEYWWAVTTRPKRLIKDSKILTTNTVGIFFALWSLSFSNHRFTQKIKIDPQRRNY